MGAYRWFIRYLLSIDSWAGPLLGSGEPDEEDTVFSLQRVYVYQTERAHHTNLCKKNVLWCMYQMQARRMKWFALPKQYFSQQTSGCLGQAQGEGLVWQQRLGRYSFLPSWRWRYSENTDSLVNKEKRRSSQSVTIMSLLEVLNVTKIKWWDLLEDGQRRCASLGTRPTHRRAYGEEGEGGSKSGFMRTNRVGIKTVSSVWILKQAKAVP